MFEFVVHDGDRGFSKETKTRIRKQAMRAVTDSHPTKPHPTGTSRAGHDVKNEKALCEALIKTQSKVEHGSEEDEDQNQPKSTRRSRPTLSMPSMLYPNYHAQIMDPVDLSALTMAHIGAASRSLLVDGDLQLGDLLGCRQASYFSHLHQLAGQSACLDDALDCLRAKIFSVLAPTHIDTSSLTLAKYGRALKSLQSAMYDHSSWNSPEVLCAVLLMSLFELFNAPTEYPWFQHVSGAARLMQLRGPDSFKTEFELDMLVAIVGPVACNAFVQNKACFLDSDIWQKKLLSAAKFDKHNMFNDRSPLAIAIYECMTLMPGAAHKATKIIFGQEPPTPEELRQVIADVNSLRRKIRQWRTTFQPYMFSISAQSGQQADQNKRIELWGTSLVLGTILNRLTSSLVPSMREMAEEEALATAEECMNLLNGLPKLSYRARFYLSQKVKLARAALDTAKLWEESMDSGKIIEGWKFQEWCDRMARITE